MRGDELNRHWESQKHFRPRSPLTSRSQLRCLYLERNLISSIEGLEGLDNLVQVIRGSVTAVRACSKEYRQMIFGTRALRVSRRAAVAPEG